MPTPTNRALLAALLMSAGATGALADPVCRARPDATGRCFNVAGALQLYEGTPSARIKAGRRMFGIIGYVDENNETFSAPEALRKAASFDTPLLGTFRICPLEKARPGAMQTVCVERGVPAKSGK